MFVIRGLIAWDFPISTAICWTAAFTRSPGRGKTSSIASWGWSCTSSATRRNRGACGFRRRTGTTSAEVFLAVIRNDFAVLRSFRGQSSLATYLTVIARRIVVRELLARGPGARLSDAAQHAPQAIPDPHMGVEQRMIDREEVEQLLSGLQGTEALVVRMYHLEGKSYQEIGALVGMPENSIGPILSRARDKLRRAARGRPAVSGASPQDGNPLYFVRLETSRWSSIGGVRNYLKIRRVGRVKRDPTT